MTISDSDIAIIAMACRFPGADSVEDFWEVLRDGRETLTRWTDEELLAAGVPAERLADPNYVKAGQDIPGTDLFDGELFGFTRDEAEILDPQHRVFLECALEALERSGHDPQRLDGHVGVYAGAGMNTYLLNNLSERYRAAGTVDHYRLMLANDKDFLATRVSYKLDLRGPSVNVNTACSTSLVAVHTACLALLGGECDMALAGAVHLGPAGQGYQHQQGMIFSPDGHCRAFDAEARGTVIGSGAGVVVLKRLKDALADGDKVHAVIKGSAVNNDGSAKTGYTAPSITGQAEVIADAQEVADVEPDSIGYVEAHGTGTPLGDPIEVAALTEAFREGTDRSGFCALGSVKTNIGHLDTAAGMAGLIKTALMLEHRTLVPSLHFSEPNPEIDFESSPFYVATDTTEWTAGEGPRRAGVSSFGIGGTNGHVILQEPPPAPPLSDERGPELLVLSARSKESLKAATTQLARHLRQRRDLPLSAVAQTLALGRRAHQHRIALVADSTRDAAMALALGAEDRVTHGVVGKEPEPPVLVFTGAAPTAEAATELYTTVPAYQEAADDCVTALPGVSAADVLAEGGPRATLLHEYALASTLRNWGIDPAGLAVTGSAGLPAAAAFAGALDSAAAFAWATGGEPTPSRTPNLPVRCPRTGEWLADEDADRLTMWTADSAANTPALTEDANALVLGGEADGPQGRAQLLSLAARAWALGVRLDLAAVHAGAQPCRVPLPTHRFERQRYWVEPGTTVSTPARPAGEGRLAGQIDPADPEGAVALLTDYLVTEIGAVLGGRDRAAVDGNLFDLGLDSLVLIEVIAKLSDELETEVSPTAFIEFPTIRGFVDHLTEEMGIGQTAAGAGAVEEPRTSRRARRAVQMSDGD